ncbi:MAG: GNAT family N-acetyltransferase, partial [Casimicrobium sp.]
AKLWDAYVETTHERAIAWLASRGFVSLKVNHVYQVQVSDAKFEPSLDVLPPQPHMINAIVALTQEAFPNGYLTREDFEAPPSDQAITLALWRDERLLGCVHASFEPGQTEAHIDYLVVTDDMRRQGIGRRLLSAALHWAFTVRNAPQVALVVVEGNANAVSLYESAGFKLTGTGRHLRLTQ